MNARGAGAAVVRRWVLFTALAIVPVLTLIVSGAFTHAIGQRWNAVSYDPDYSYLLNSLNLAEGAAPHHTDHPGTPVQLLGAVVLSARHLAVGSGTLRDQVLRDPESALSAISIVIRLGYGAALFVLGCSARRLSGNVMCGIATQAVAAIPHIGLSLLWRVNPEPVLMTLSLLLGSAMLLGLASDRRHSPRHAALCGVLVGVGLATKVTFFPLLVAPVWALNRARLWGIYIGSVAAAFLIAVAPILGQAGRVASWMWGLVVSDARYGNSRGHAVVDPTRYGFDLRRMIAGEPFSAAIIAGSTLLLACFWLSAKRRTAAPELRDRALALACVTLAQTAQFVMVAKHPGARYLVPALSLVGVNVCLGWTIIAGAYPLLLRRVAAAVGGAALLGWVCWSGLAISADWARLAASRASSNAFWKSDAVRSLPPDAVMISSFSSSSPIYALNFADAWAGRRYAADLDRLFPRQVTIDDLTGELWHAGERVSDDQLRAWAAAGRLYGHGLTPRLPSDLEATTESASGAERLYRVRVRSVTRTAPPPR
jgi:hypothetical protein